MIRSKRMGFTLVELLVVIAIIGILIGMTLPAVQALREASRRSLCTQNLTKISLGLADYSLTYGAYPSGSVNPTGPIRNVAEGYHHNWIAGLLPYVDYNSVAQAIDPTASIYADVNAEVLSKAAPIFRCPSSANLLANVACYAGVQHPSEAPIQDDNWGVFILNKQIADDDVVDGLSVTLFVSEKLGDGEPELGWLSGTRASLRNTGHKLVTGGMLPSALPTGDNAELFIGGFASQHSGGVNALVGDGSTRFLAQTVDSQLLAQLADRRDGAIGGMGLLD